MRIISFLSAAILSSSCVQALGAAELYGMIPIKKDYKDSLTKTQPEYSLTLPPGHSQDSLGMCFSTASALLLDTEMCRGQARDLSKCAGMDDSERIAPLDLSRFAKTDVDADSWGTRTDNMGLIEGGAMSFTLQSALKAKFFANEKCAPFDQIVNSNSDDDIARKTEQDMWNRLKALYTKNRGKCAECDQETVTAVDNIAKNFNIKNSNQDILKAFAEDTYQKFQDKLLIPKKCLDPNDFDSTDMRAEFAKSVKVDTFPPSQMDPKSAEAYKEFIKKTKELLKDKTPVGLTFCSQKGKLTAKNRLDCGGGSAGNVSKSVSGQLHAVVIKGFRRVCKANPIDDCYDALQIQNSWGESWQKGTDGGWVDAKELMNRTFYAPNSLVWLK